MRRSRARSLGAARRALQVRRLAVLALACAAAVLPGSARASLLQRWVGPRDSSGRAVQYEARRFRMAAAVPDLGSAPAVAMSMRAQLADNLALLFERFGTSEFIVCLEGETNEAGDFRLRDFRMPHIAYSRSTSAGVDPDGTCSQYRNIVGTLHNHPPKYPEDRGREFNNCYLSRTDIVSWLKHSDYAYTAVMCGPRLWAWWHRSQVDESDVLAFPPTGQLYGRTSERDADS